MTIYQKLLEVRKSVKYLQTKNQGYQFKYVSSSQTLGALRKEMDNQGLILVPKILKKNVQEHKTAKGTLEFFTELEMEFVWVDSADPTQTVTCPWYGQGIDTGEKGVGKALTYAEKYFLLKFFNIATDLDDPDAHTPKPIKQAPAVTSIPVPEEVQKLLDEKKIMKAKGEAMWQTTLKICRGDKVKATEMLKKQILQPYQGGEA